MGKKIYGLLGRKLGHSWSVPIHRALGCEDYKLIELEPEKLGEFLAREDIGGLNVTIPYKRDVMSFCDVIDPAAEAIGSVNTIVRRDGRLYGYNTDIDGFLYMAKRAGISVDGKVTLVLGSGGASLTAQTAAKRGGAKKVVVISRNGPDNYKNLERHSDATVIINTTPVGMWPDMDGRPLDLTVLPNVNAVLDVVYNPGRTSLLLQAEELDLSRAGGLPMLVAQAKRAEELFFDTSIPDDRTERIINQLWQDMTNIVLVGMPGCGKTTVGRKLEKLSGKPFVDLDEEIVQRAGKSIPDIFAQEGETFFRNLEAQALADACAKSGQIIATGGGAVLRPENRAAMRRTGWVYFLRRALEALPTAGRPLSQRGSLEEMYHIRKPLYAAAADTVIDNSVSVEETAELIWRDFCASTGDKRP